MARSRRHFRASRGDPVRVLVCAAKAETDESYDPRRKASAFGGVEGGEHIEEVLMHLGPSAVAEIATARWMTFTLVTLDLIGAYDARENRSMTIATVASPVPAVTMSPAYRARKPW
jgi:hypothetical protein